MLHVWTWPWVILEFGKRFWVSLWVSFWVRLVFEMANWISRLPYCSSQLNRHHLSHQGPDRTKRLRKGVGFLPDLVGWVVRALLAFGPLDSGWNSTARCPEPLAPQCMAQLLTLISLCVLVLWRTLIYMLCSSSLDSLRLIKYFIC